MTYLLLITPGAEPLVERWRAQHDRWARHGIPAHVTVRTPFLTCERWGDPEVSSVLTRFLPTPVTLSRLEDRPGGLVILAEPDAALWRITDATTAAWPDLGAHKDGRPDAAFHVTVVRTRDADARRTAAEAIEPQLPLTVEGTAFWASQVESDGGLTKRVLAGV